MAIREGIFFLTRFVSPQLKTFPVQAELGSFTWQIRRDLSTFCSLSTKRIPATRQDLEKHRHIHNWQSGYFTWLQSRLVRVKHLHVRRASITWIQNVTSIGPIVFSKTL